MPKSATHNTSDDPELMSLILAIVRNDAPAAAALLDRQPALAQAHLAIGATRAVAKEFYFDAIGHYLYVGDTPLHAASAGNRVEIARALIENGANIAAENRRGATPLHYAADGGPNVGAWNPQAQADIIVLLIESGANPNALDKSGVAPLHRAVRTRCPSAVAALLHNGADIQFKNKNGSTPLHLAVQNTGRGGSGSPEAKANQKEIIELLLKSGASKQARDARGKTPAQCTITDWILAML
jgi:ankyrin repeat protein